MNILVIGGTRFMGKHLVRTLLKNGHSVTIATRGLSEDPFGSDVSRVRFQRTNLDSIRDMLSHQTFDIVYDSLAYCSNDVKSLLDTLSCKRYITISTTAVYQKHIDTKETDFDPNAEKVIWCERNAFPYAESKRQAERALAQKYGSINSVAVRFPFVIGKDDYTNRLAFYIEHIILQKPMYVDNLQNKMAFVRSDEAGAFLAFFSQNDFVGKINGASSGAISILDIAEYVERKTGKKAILNSTGDVAPYNGENAYTINTDLAASLGFAFTPLHEWIYELIDYYIEKAMKL